MLLCRFKIVNDATTVRLSPKYSTDKQVIEIVKFFHLKTTCCEKYRISGNFCDK